MKPLLIQGCILVLISLCHRSLAGTGCINTFKVFQNKNAYGATLLLHVTTEQACLDACIADAACLAVDIDSSACWVHTNPTNPLYLRMHPGMNHFVLNRDCPGVTTTIPVPSTSTVTTTTSAPPTSTVTTTTSAPPTSTAGTGCNNTFKVFQNSNAFGATLLPNVTTQQACLDACVANAACLAVDMDIANSLCWVHTNPTNQLIQGLALGVNHFELNRDCPGVTTTTPVPSTSTGSGGSPVV